VKVSSESLPGSRVELTIEAEVGEYQIALEEAYRRIASRVNIHGFRRGKAPRPIVLRSIGEGVIEEEATRILMPKIFSQAVEETGIQPVSDPEFDITSSDPFVVKATLPVRPSVPLGNYRDLRLTRESPVITESQVDAEITRTRERLAEWVEVQRPAAKGDITILNAEGYAGHRPILYSSAGQELAHAEKGDIVIQDENWVYMVDPEMGYPLPGFAEKIIGMEIGAEQEFRLPVPGDDPRFEKSKYAGQDLFFRVQLKQVQEKTLPELNDEMAKKAGGRDTLAGLREDLKEMLLARAKGQEEERLASLVVDMASAQSQFEMPEILIERQAQRALARLEERLQRQNISLANYLNIAQQSDADMRREMRLRAEKEIKSTFVVESIADAENIAITPEEVEEEIVRLGMAMGDGSRVRREFSDPDRRLNLESNLREAKTIRWLVENATQEDTTPATPSPEELASGEPPMSESVNDDNPPAEGSQS
jgi:trigger factor